MNEAPKSGTYYTRADAAALIRHLARRETRTVADQVAVIVREACERRGIDVKAVLAEAGLATAST